MKRPSCYNGDPDVDFAKSAQAFGVEGRPYLLDIHVERDGVGAATAWHPGYSIAARRTRRV